MGSVKNDSMGGYSRLIVLIWRVGFIVGAYSGNGILQGRPEFAERVG